MIRRHAQRVVVRRATFHLQPTGPWLECEWRYWPADPVSVQLAIPRPDGRWAVWCFARDLLADGLFDEFGVGDGDISLSAHGPDLHIRLHAPDGRAHLVGSVFPAEDFLAETLGLVPPAREQQLVTDAVAALVTEMERA